MDLDIKDQIIVVMKVTFILALAWIGYIKAILPLYQIKVDVPKELRRILAFITYALFLAVLYVFFEYIKLLVIVIN